MPFRSRGRSFGRPTRRRRGMDWAGAASTAGVIQASGTVSAGYIVLPSTVRTEYTDPTLVRTRGVFSWFIPSTLTFVRAAMGIIEWADPDDVPPVAAGDMPLPSSRPDMDWIYHRWLIQSSGTGANVFRDFEIDSKAMRKLGNAKGILLVVESSSATAGSFQFAYGVRCLLKDG